MSVKPNTKVKICGIRSPEEIELAALYGADAVGFITEVPIESPRKLDSGTAASLIKKVPDYLDSVLVIMPENSARAIEIIEKVSPDIVQIHSALSLPEIGIIKEKTDIPIIKILTLPAQEEAEEIPDNSILISNLLEQVRHLEESAVVDSVLLDTGKSGKPGRTGSVHNWAVSRQIARETRLPLILAGGLKPENVQEAIRTVSPYAVDVASGVENDGKKDAKKMKKFIEEVRYTNAFL